MADVVVTVPKDFWPEWIAEGDAAGDPPTGEAWDFGLGGRPPQIGPGERVYIVCRGRLRGYAPLVELRVFTSEIGPRARTHGFSLIRRGDAVAVTIADTIPGFRGFRYRWWDRAQEVPFPNWKED